MRSDTRQLRSGNGFHRQRASDYHLQAATCLSYLVVALFLEQPICTYMELYEHTQ